MRIRLLDYRKTSSRHYVFLEQGKSTPTLVEFSHLEPAREKILADDTGLFL
jgi:hypothetical protein